eukprot:TRINITY_DN7430_c0_g1_i1.p1 TRINITY_DN7430_c0_g1~~TRINITY_DN7430_c0_g1_i1.p1  ORF type:complete len:649 (-),score=123.79 TRINITY_DN7430_c0_g1_i1:129-2075(-)
MQSVISETQIMKDKGLFISKDLENEARMQEAAFFDPSVIERDPFATADASLTFEGITYSVKATDPFDPAGKRKVDKVILEDCSGHISAGSLVALMGPSGCGKSTLLDILARKKKSAHEGNVLLNGQKLDSMYRRIVSYVSQKDIMPTHWTVREAIAFNAGLKNPKPAGVSCDEFNRFIDDIIEDVGLSHVAHSKIGGGSIRGISGGQKRRVTLARGIAANPSLMFCDEPTSGLSSTDAELCVKTMLGLTRQWNTTIIVVIHQPRLEVARLFNHLILLTSRPGRMVYNGPMDGIAAYLETASFPVPTNVNPTDHFLDLVTPGAPTAEPDTFVAQYQHTQQAEVEAAVKRATETLGKSAMDLLVDERGVQLQFGRRLSRIRRGAFSKGFCTQLYHVFCRKLQLTLRDMELLGLTVAMKAFLGLFLGLVFQGVGKKEPKGIAQLSFVFMILIQVSLGALNLLPIIIEERTIMKLEESDGLYCVSAHMLAQTIVDTAVSLIGSAAQVTIMYFMAEFEPEFFPAIFVCTLLCGLAMESLVLMMAATGKNAQAAQASATPVVMIFILFSGFLVNRNTSPEFLKWLLEISPISHTIEMVAWQLYGDDAMAWGNLQMAYGFQEPSATAYLGVNLSVMAVARMLQVIFLSKLNNIEH